MFKNCYTSGTWIDNNNVQVRIEWTKELINLRQYLLTFCSDLPVFRPILKNAEIEGEVLSVHAVMAYGGSGGSPIDRLTVDFDTRWTFVLRFVLLGRLFPKKDRHLLAH